MYFAQLSSLLYPILSQSPASSHETHTSDPSDKLNDSAFTYHSFDAMHRFLKSLPSLHTLSLIVTTPPITRLRLPLIAVASSQ